MSKLPSSSPDRNTFQRDAYVARRAENGQEAADDDYLAMLENQRLQHKLKWQDPDHCVDNMEYDLVTTDWILAKTRASEAYAQNLYAAMCNNEFQRNDVWPRLSNQTWGCSWRSAGGIIADMRQKGDYIDWYCSGINNGDWQRTPEEVACLSITDPREYYHMQKQFVSESAVTDEIREDLFRLGWLVIGDDLDN